MTAKSVKIVLALCCVGIALPALAEDCGPSAPEFIWHDIGGIAWRFHGNARIVGDELVCVADASNRTAYAVGKCDLSEYDGKPMQMQIVASSDDVTRSEKDYLGFRFLLSYLDMEMGGHRVWPNGGRLDGTRPPTEILWRDVNPKRRGECEIQLGLHDCTGRAVFNLRTLQARATSPLVPKINEGDKVKYPDRVKNAPRGRGVMLGEMNEEAWDELKSWGVNLVRHQINLRGTGPATNHAEYARGYLENFDKQLDELEKNLAAARARGIRVCIDQHSSPGGACDAGDPAEWRGDNRMFHDPFYAQLFIDCWVKLAQRVAPYRDAIYGYDLKNEAHHNSPALPGGDIVGLQQRCAKAIREVDPDTPIVVESMFGDPGWFRSLSAINLDNVIYSAHVYYPHDYTHQGILTPPERVENWPDPKKGWDRDFLRRQLKPVLDFQKEHDAKIFIGEFSVISWAPNAEGYIRDCITLFEEFGWDWCYHAYREYQGWSVQHEPLSRGFPGKFRKSESNPRMDVLREGLRGAIHADPESHVSPSASFSSHWLLETNAIELAGSHFMRQIVEAEFSSAADAEKAALSFRELPPGMEMSVSARSDDSDHRHFANVRALAEAGAKGTYYLNRIDGKFAEKAVREILARGSSVGGHTTSHPSLPKLNANAIFDEILGNRIAIESAADTCVNAFTLPYCAWRSAENPDATLAIGEALRRAGYLGGGDVLVDPAAAYGLPAGSFVGTLRFSYNDNNPSPELFEQEIGKAEKRFLNGDFPPCGPHVTMGMHSWAKPEGMENVTRAFETRTRNPDAPFAGRTWFCNENEFIAAWMQKNHSCVISTERDGTKVRWTLLRPDPAGLGADVPLSVQIEPRPAALRSGENEIELSAFGQGAIPTPARHGLPAVVGLVVTKDVGGDPLPAEKFPGLAARLDVDLEAGTALLVLRNDGDKRMGDIRLVMRVPLAFDADVRGEHALSAGLLPSDSLVLRFELKRIHDTPWYCEGPSLFDAELDFILDGSTARLHVTRRIDQPPATPDAEAAP